MQQAHQLALQASMLDNKAKNQNITQTGLENQTTANGVIGNFARGLGAIQAAGGDPAIAAPELAHQLGIPIGQAQAIVDQEKKQPGFLKILADNADKADKAEKFAMALTAATDKDGNPVFIQPGSSGTVKAVDGYKPIGQTSTIDSGDAVHVTDKRTGKDVRTITKSGGPATGEAPITDASGKVVGYHPLPGSIASTNQQKSQTEIDKARADVAAKQAKAKADAENARQGYAGSTTAIGVIKQNIDKLDKLQAQPGGGQNIIGSVANYMQGSAIGQRFAAATGSEVADARQKIKAAGQALLLSAAKGQGQLFRNQAEQKAFLESINNPQSTISAMRQALTLAQSRLLSPPSSAAAPSGRPAALPSRSTTRPAASGWGKAQVVQ